MKIYGVGAYVYYVSSRVTNNGVFMICTPPRNGQCINVNKKERGVVMLKKVYMLITVVCSLLFIFACNSTNSSNDDKQFIPPEITISDSSLSDMHTMALANVRRYHFIDNNDTYNFDLASQFENIVYIYNEFFDVNMPLQTIFVQDTERYSIRTIAGQNLIINPYDSTTYGWFVYSMALGYIPMWLSVGMEMTIRGIDFYYPLSSLCDMYFAPFTWNTTEHRQAISTSYRFVNYLHENNYLSEVVTLYLLGDYVNANLLASEHFSLFSDYELNTYFSLSYSGTSFTISANTDMAHYTFDFPEFHSQVDWPDVEVWDSIRLMYDVDHINVDTLTKIIEYIDDAIYFVKDWYSQYIDFDFAPIKTHIPMWFMWGAGADPTQMTIPINGLTSAAHEASHIISFALGGSDFLPFDEGLATTLGLQHTLFDINRFGWGYQLEHLQTIAAIPTFYEAGAFQNYDEAIAVRDFVLEDFENIVTFQHFLAYFAINIPAMRRTYAVLSQWPGGGTPPEIHSYMTSGSFVRYLIEMYGAELYLQVHFEVGLFEYVYGVTIQ